MLTIARLALASEALASVVNYKIPHGASMISTQPNYHSEPAIAAYEDIRPTSRVRLLIGANAS